MAITYTIETLHHFRCSRCEAWWSIGDWDQPAYDETMCCPQCWEMSTPQKKECTP